MSLTPSTMIDLGTKAPDFQLPDTISGKVISLADFSKYQALLVIFMCCHCPYVKHVEQQLAKLGQDYPPEGSLGIVAISANDVTHYPADHPDRMKEMAKTLGFTFPFYYDESQEVAKAYSAACTPDFFLFDQAKSLVYRGQLDSSRPGNNIPVTGEDLRGAIAAVLSHQPINPDQKPAMGCNIKWKR